MTFWINSAGVCNMDRSELTYIVFLKIHHVEMDLIENIEPEYK
jgi:hypothetical protein